MSESVDYNWPAKDGDPGQAIITDGSGVLSFTAPSTSFTHNILSITHSDTATDTVSRGSLIYGNATPKWDELVKGAANTFLKSNGTDVAWASLLVSSPATLTGATIGWDSTLIDATTWSDGANASNIWTFDVSGTDHTMTAGSGIMTFSLDVQAKDLILTDWQSGSPTYTSLHDWMTVTQSAGLLSGGAITVNAADANKVDVALGTGFVKKTNAVLGETVFIDWGATEAISLTNNATNKIYVNYNTDTGAVTVAATTGALNYNTQFSIGKVYREDTVLHRVNGGTQVYNLAKRAHKRARELREWERASGLVISAPNDLKIAVSSGVVYAGLNRFETDVFDGIDTNDTDTFVYYYRDSPTGWKTQTAQTDINNVSYDDGSGTLGELNPNKYGVHWVYVDHDNHLYIQYGQGDYKLAEAQEALVPDAPAFLDDFAFIIGKIIIKKSDTSFTSIESAFETIFMPSVVFNHNDLGSLDTGDYQHLTQSEHDVWAAVTASAAELNVMDGIAGLATPSNGDTTHLSTADQIYDWVIGLSYITATLTQEEVEDYVGGMLDGTETLISVSYDDDVGNNIDFVVDNDLHKYSWTNVVDADITDTLTSSVCTGEAATVATITGLAPDTATSQAAQPNITSVGTLTSLGCGAITSSGMLTLDSAAALILLHDSGTDVGHYLMSSDTTESSGYGEFSIWRCTGGAAACTLGDNPPILWADNSLNTYITKNLQVGSAGPTAGDITAYGSLSCGAITATTANITTEASGYQVDGNIVISRHSEGHIWIGGAGNFTMSTLGGENVAVGKYAGSNLTSGYENLLFGSQAGLSLTEGYQNILLGNTSAPNLTTGHGCIIIGSALNASAAAAVDELNIGGVLTGVMTSASESLALPHDKQFYFGTGKDVSLQFDGEDLIVNSEEVTEADEVHFTNFTKYTFDNSLERGNTVIGDGTITDATGLSLAANVGVTGTLSVDGNTQLGNANTDLHGINTAVASGTMLNTAFNLTALGTTDIYEKWAFTHSGNCEDAQKYLYGHHFDLDYSGAVTDVGGASGIFMKGYFLDLDLTSDADVTNTGVAAAQSTHGMHIDLDSASDITGATAVVYYYGIETDVSFDGTYDGDGDLTLYGSKFKASNTAGADHAPDLMYACRFDVSGIADVSHGVFGYNSGSSGSAAYGGYFSTTATPVATGNYYGVYGKAENGDNATAYGGYFIGENADTNYGIYARGVEYAGYFSGPVETTGALTVGGAVIATPDEITAESGVGTAASVATLNTEVTTNGDSDLDNVTLANGTSGQVKHIYCVVEGNVDDTWKITPATMCGGTQITFAGVGEGCTLVYADNEGWVVTANNGGTID